MKLSDASLSLLGDLHAGSTSADDRCADDRCADDRCADDRCADDRCADDRVIDSASALGLMAHTTPAWTEPYVAILDRLIEGRRGVDDQASEAVSVMFALRAVRSRIDTSTDRRRDRRQSANVVEPGGDANAELAELLRHPAGDARRTAAIDAGPGAWDRLLAGPMESCPQVVGVDVATMMLDQAEWIGGNLHLGLAPLVEDPSRFTSFRVVGAEPRIWDLHGIQNARMESTMSGLNVRVPMVKADITLIRSSY